MWLHSAAPSQNSIPRRSSPTIGLAVCVIDEFIWGVLAGGWWARRGEQFRVVGVMPLLSDFG